MDQEIGKKKVPGINPTPRSQPSAPEEHKEDAPGSETENAETEEATLVSSKEASQTSAKLSEEAVNESESMDESLKASLANVIGVVRADDVFAKEQNLPKKKEKVGFPETVDSQDGEKTFSPKGMEESKKGEERHLEDKNGNSKVRKEKNQKDNLKGTSEAVVRTGGEGPSDGPPFSQTYPRTYEAKIITKFPAVLYRNEGQMDTAGTKAALSDIMDSIDSLENNQKMLVSQGMITNPELYKEYEANKQALKNILSERENSSVQITTATLPVYYANTDHQKKEMGYSLPSYIPRPDARRPQDLMKDVLEDSGRPIDHKLAQNHPSNLQDTQNFIDCNPNNIYIDMVVPFVQPNNIVVEYEKNVIIITGFYEAKDKYGQNYKSFGKKIVVPKNTNLASASACLCWDPVSDIHKICIEAVRV